MSVSNTKKEKLFEKLKQNYLQLSKEQLAEILAQITINLNYK